MFSSFVLVHLEDQKQSMFWECSSKWSLWSLISDLPLDWFLEWITETRGAKNATAKHWDVEDGDQGCLRSIKRVGAAMSKGNQWIAFVRNACIWSLLRLGPEFVCGRNFAVVSLSFSLVCNKGNIAKRCDVRKRLGLWHVVARMFR
jgi:hypothetical protein